MALTEGAGFTVRDVGKPDFRDHMRRATGGTLKVPTLAERTAGAGGFIGFSNVSPGAAYFLDPENFGHVYHRAGSFAPGGKSLEPPAVSHDTAGDKAMTARFCDEVLRQRRPAVSILWLTDPDHTLHGAPLGSPQHLAALRGADACVGTVVETVAALRREGTEILLAVGSTTARRRSAMASMSMTGSPGKASPVKSRRAPLPWRGRELRPCFTQFPKRAPLCSVCSTACGPSLGPMTSSWAKSSPGWASRRTAASLPR